MPLGFLLKTLLSCRKSIPLSTSTAAVNQISDFFSIQCSKSTSGAFSSASEIHQNDKDASFTVSDLIESFGLTVNAAKRCSTKLKSSNNPSVVLRFFKEYGFSDAQIARIVRMRPQVLLSDPERFLKPKVEIFASFGASVDNVTQIVEKCPVILCSSVENRLLPSLESLRRLVGEDAKVVQMMLRWHNLFYHQLQDTLSPNVATLLEAGVSERVIWKTLSHRMHGLLCPHDRFEKVVNKVKEMGFDVNKFRFVEAVIAITKLTDHVWDQRCRAFRKWGWSDMDLVNAFLKHPLYMGCNENKIDEIMDFLVNYMGFNPSLIAKTPWIFKYRKERIVSRYSLVKTLFEKGVITKDDWNLGSVVTRLEPVFIEKYVTRHEKILPELLGVYSQSKKDGKPF